MKRLCVIPARKGSKRIPNKNIKDFCGKPMVAHAISAAASTGLFDVIHVSTDSDEIVDLAARFGAMPDFKRPEELADDHASMLEVVRFVIDKYAELGKVFDTVMMLYATSPLVGVQDINGACRQFENNDTSKALLAVTPFPSPIEQAFRLSSCSDDLAPDNMESFSMRTQDLNHAYYDAGMFCYYTPDFIRSVSGAGDFMRFRGYVVPSYRVTDIDYPEDWERAEKLYESVGN